MRITKRMLMELRPRCPSCRSTLTRIILPETEWNESKQYLLHCKHCGHVFPIEDIEELVRRTLEEQAEEEEGGIEI